MIVHHTMKLQTFSVVVNTSARVSLWIQIHETGFFATIRE